jgi:hypothetical protein
VKLGEHGREFLILLGVIALAGLVAGCVLALGGYSSAGPFSVAAACVGVLGTLAAQQQGRDGS